MCFHLEISMLVVHTSLKYFFFGLNMKGDHAIKITIFSSSLSMFLFSSFYQYVVHKSDIFMLFITGQEGLPSANVSAGQLVRWGAQFGRAITYRSV